MAKRFLRICTRGIACHSPSHHLRAMERLSAAVPVSRARGVASGCSAVTATAVPATGSLRVTGTFSRTPSSVLSAHAIAFQRTIGI